MRIISYLRLVLSMRIHSADKMLNWRQDLLVLALTQSRTRRMAIANCRACVSWVAYAPGTIAVNVTCIEREFNACQTPRSMYPSIFNHF